MKRLIIAALVLVASASFNTALAAKKKEKVQLVQSVTVLKTSSDSISYAAGKAATQGLIPFIQQQYNVDTTYMADFARGFEEGTSRTNDPKFVAYMAGMQIASMAAKRILPSVRTTFADGKDSISAEFFYKGFVAALLKDNSVYTDSAAFQLFDKSGERIKAEKDSAYKAENEAWLAENAKKEGVVTLPSGLQYKIIKQGKGRIPTTQDEVVVKYAGRLIDGTEFDSSYKRNPQTSWFRADAVIKGWTEALTMMPTGSEWELYIPQDLAYGSRQAGQIKPFSTLIFKVELVEVKDVVREASGSLADEKKASGVRTKKSAPAKKASKTKKKK